MNNMVSGSIVTFNMMAIFGAVVPARTSWVAAALSATA